MKITHVEVSGFRGFRAPVRIDLAADFNVIDGRNGVGKSTIFDAVEFALTGRITKYGQSKAAGETVDDYLWWTGDAPAPLERYVEVGFVRDDNERTVIRRTPVGLAAPELMATLEASIVHGATAPVSPLQQLCASTIIRDELIATFSLDLPEAERYALLRQAIGAGDADIWTEKGQQLARLAKRKLEAAVAAVSEASSTVAEAQRRVDEARAAYVPDTAVVEATSQLRQLLSEPKLAAEHILPAGRKLVADLDRKRVRMDGLLAKWDLALKADERALVISSEIQAEKAEIEAAKAARENLVSSGVDQIHASADRSDDLHLLRQLGERTGLIEGCCPLCAAGHDDKSFLAGLERMSEIVARIDAGAATAAKLRSELRVVDERISQGERRVIELETERAGAAAVAEEHATLLRDSGIPEETTREEVEAARNLLTLQFELASHAVRVLGTQVQNAQLERATADLDEATERLKRAQDRAGRARQAEQSSSALHDAARRAAGETLDMRLQRVLPLMAELYGRLRPHPFWKEIEYFVRGDVKRFLSLRVGDGLNPQFLFSSGQRRATGLAFLLSIYLSLAWSRWRSILLDDPVQHVDDFRTVNLAEVLAQLVREGRQVIVAVEDAALADMLCRRLPVRSPEAASRFTIGLDTRGTPRIVDQQRLRPFTRHFAENVFPPSS